MKKLSAVDVFCGPGGLSSGLRRSGFSVRGAVDLNDVSVATYRRNHRGTKVLCKDVTEVSGGELSGGRRIDLLAGCAPCQGFCSLTSKHRREDPRNELVLQMSRLAAEMEPDAILMENVPGLMTRGAGLLAEFEAELRSLGYLVTCGIVQMADFGVPQRRRRFVLLAGRGFAIPLPQPTHSRDGESGTRVWRTVRDAIGGNRAPVTLSRSRGCGGPIETDWHVVRDLQPQTKARLRAAMPGKTWIHVEESLRPACHRGGYKGFTNVYGRMYWDQPSSAITSGCTTPAKGRFGHPDRRRTTISVREAATLQTFPSDYIFASEHIDKVCEMIGNAVPPRFAEVVGRRIREKLIAHRRAISGNVR